MRTDLTIDEVLQLARSMSELKEVSKYTKSPVLTKLLKAPVTYLKQFKKLTIVVAGNYPYVGVELLQSMDNYAKAVAFAAAQAPLLLMGRADNTYYLNQKLTELLALDPHNMGGKWGRVEAYLGRRGFNIELRFRVITNTCKSYTLKQFLDEVIPSGIMSDTQFMDKLLDKLDERDEK